MPVLRSVALFRGNIASRLYIFPERSHFYWMLISIFITSSSPGISERPTVSRKLFENIHKTEVQEIPYSTLRKELEKGKQILTIPQNWLSYVEMEVVH